MNDLENRRLTMLIRVRGFASQHANDFSAASLGRQLFAAVDSAIEELQRYAAVQVSGVAHDSVISKASARTNLKGKLRTIRQTAKAMTLAASGLAGKFPLPPRPSDRILLNTAHAFLTDATPLKTEFLRYEMTETFLEDLQTDIEAFEVAIDTTNSKTSSKLTAATGIDQALAKGLQAVQQLQAVVKNKYRNDPVTLAAWKIASHIERANKTPKPGTDVPPIAALPSATTTEPEFVAR